MKTLLSVQSLLRARPEEQRPQLVAELFDPRKAAVAREAIGKRVEVVCSDLVISRLISQSVRHPGLARILFGLLSHRQGNSLYLRGFPELAGASLAEASSLFRAAVVLGFLRADGAALRAHMDPAAVERLEAGDLLILLAESFERCQPAALVRSQPLERAPPLQRPPRSTRDQRLLILGWSHKVASILLELDQSAAGRFDVTILTRVAAAEREQWLERIQGAPPGVRIRHVEGDYTLESDLVRLDPAGFDSVLFLASSGMSSSEEADARTLLGYLLLSSVLKRSRAAPEILVELLDPDNLHLFAESRDTVIVSPRVVSHLLAHMALRPGLSLVFDEMFGAGGAEIDLLPVEELGLVGRSLAFPEVQQIALARGILALGFVTASDPQQEIHLNPDRARVFQLGSEDRVVILTTDP